MNEKWRRESADNTDSSYRADEKVKQEKAEGKWVLEEEKWDWRYMYTISMHMYVYKHLPFPHFLKNWEGRKDGIEMGKFEQWKKMRGGRRQWQYASCFVKHSTPHPTNLERILGKERWSTFSIWSKIPVESRYGYKWSQIPLPISTYVKEAQTSL